MEPEDFTGARCLVLSLCLLLVGACAQPQPADLAIRGTTVVDVTDGSLVHDQTVLVEGNRITAIGPVEEVRVSDGAEVLEAEGGYLVPGLWDMHVHSAAKVDWHFPLYLAHGVTGVRNMNAGMQDALARTTDIQRRLAEGELRGPRFLANGPTIDGDPPMSTRPVVVRTAAEARTAVDSLADGGADFIKVHENLSREAYFAVMDQAQRSGLPVDGHVPFRVLPEEATDAGQRTVEHLRGMEWSCSTEAEAERKKLADILNRYPSMSGAEQFLTVGRHLSALYDTRDPAACVMILEAYRRNGTAVVPTLAGSHHIANPELVLSDEVGMRRLPASLRREWEFIVESEPAQTLRSLLRPVLPLQRENVRLLSEAGVLLLAGTDVGFPLLVPGISLHQELTLMAEAGLTPLQALQTATLNPARVLGMTDSLGTVEAGKIADLVLLDANPLEDIANTRRIRAVVADGRVYRRADLDRLLSEVEARP